MYDSHVREWYSIQAHQAVVSATNTLCSLPQEYRAWLINVMSTILFDRESELRPYGWRFFPGTE